MIPLTRLNGSRFFLNAEHIQLVEALPDTHVLLTNGQQYVVREPAQQVADLTLAYQQRVRGTFRLLRDLPATDDQDESDERSEQISRFRRQP